jgi:hypothetical protein
MTQLSADQHLRQHQWNSWRMIAEHQIKHEELAEDERTGRWVIGQPGTHIGEVEIIAGRWGTLLVHGDFDVCAFAYYGDHGDAWSLLRWMGDCTDVGYYVAQKAAIGMGNRIHEEYNADVASYELQWHLDHDHWDDDEERERFSAAFDLVHDGDYALLDYLYNNGFNDLVMDCSFGRVLSGRVVVAHACIQKLTLLLREKYGPGGPASPRGCMATERG